jgi:hypothetical protein
VVPHVLDGSEWSFSRSGPLGNEAPLPNMGGWLGSRAGLDAVGK